jgi:Domain of unknown function (DUF4124)
MKKLLLGFVFIGLMTSPLVFADKIYSWVDDKGVTHYGENPPKDTPARQLNARTGHSDPVEYSTEEKAETAKAKAATDPQPSEERCATARKNLQVLSTNPRVKATDKNGENRYMTPEEMQAQVETMEQIIAEECSGK